MGAWGYGIRQDDFVCDVIGAFEDHLKSGKSVAEATAAVSSTFAGAIEDSYDGPLVWIALAEMQWTYGGLDASVFAHVKDDFDAGRSLRPWQEDERGFVRRRVVLERFIEKIGASNPRPRRPPQTIVRAPAFEPGDCLTIRFADGRYGAALVLAADHSLAEYGRNLVGALDYVSSVPPTLEVFRQRRWLVLRHPASKDRIDVGWYLPIGFRKARSRVDVVGRIEILDSDPKDSNIYYRLASIADQAKYARRSEEP